MASGSKPSSGKDREARAARERARIYEARQAFQAGQGRRRTRDNWTAGLVAGVIVLGAVGSQVAAYSVGPWAPEPAPAPTSTPLPTPSPTVTGTPTPEPSSEDTPTPAPTTSPTP